MKAEVVLMISIAVFLTEQACGEGYDIEQHKAEAKGYIGETSKAELEQAVKKTEGFTNNPKEKNLSEAELRIKADDKVKGLDKDETDKGVDLAIDAAKSSRENENRSKHTVAKMQNKDFIKKSDAITSNPISGLNIDGDTSCKVADSDLGGENISFEEYYVDIEDTRLIHEEKKCEEDEDKLFYCNRSLAKSACASRIPCSFDNTGVEGGLYSSDSNSEFMSASGGMTWRYADDTLSFGEDREYLYGSPETGDNNCYSKSFEAKFFIKDKANVSEFRIIKIHENNLLNISINGQLIRDGVNLGGGNCWHNAGKTVWDDWDYDLIVYPSKQLNGHKRRVARKKVIARSIK